MKKDNKISIMPILLQLFVGAFAGGIIAFLAVQNAGSGSSYPIVLAIVIAFVLQIALHETGHLVFGLLSGYDFTSFRIFGVSIAKTQGKISLKRYSLAGTLGQCLMSPKAKAGEKIPTVLYNLGGIIMDFVALLLSSVIAIVFRANLAVFSSALIMLALCLISLFTNGIPMRSSLACNDGYNALTAARSYEASLAFANQLKINARSYAAERLKDMPEELFRYPDAELSNPQVASLANLRVGRLIDLGELDEAYRLGASLLHNGADLFPIYRGLLSLDMAYLSAVLFRDASVAKSYVDEDEKRLIKVLSNIPSVHRTRYALALACGNSEEAQKARSDFERTAKKHPSKAEVESESELLELARNTLCRVRQ